MSDRNFDIAIIGGGVIGLSLARALAGEGAGVAVIDAGPAIPAATPAAAGMLAPSFEHGEGDGPLGEALYRFGADGLARWAAFAAGLEEETGVFVDFRGTGALGVAYDRAGADQLGLQAARVRALGGAAALISGDEARRMEPDLSPAIVAALHAPADGQVDPRRVVAALTASLARRKVTIHRQTIAAIDESAAGAIVRTASGERYGARRVVLASGAVSGLYPRKFVFPVKGEAVAIENTGKLTHVIRAPGAYLCPKAEGRLVIGASEVHDREDLAVDPAAADALRTNAAKAAPILAGARETERWAGLRPATPDGAPILGTDAAGRYLALGHYRNGVLHAPAMAAAMTALIVDGAAPGIEGFGPERFGGDG